MPDPRAEQQKREAEARAEQAAQAAALKQRDAAIQRALAAAGGSSTNPAPGGAATGGPGLSDSYKGQVVGCIRPHVVFNVPEGLRPKQHVAEFEVQLLPSGEQVGAPRLVSASGLPAYDQAVERAIRRCDPFPRPREGADASFSEARLRPGGDALVAHLASTPSSVVARFSERDVHGAVYTRS